MRKTGGTISKKYSLKVENNKMIYNFYRGRLTFKISQNILKEEGENP